MSRITKIGLILIGAGILLLGLSYLLVGGDWTGFNSKGTEYVAKSYESSSQINEIVIDESANEVEIKTADTDKVTIEYFDDPERPMYELTEKNGRLEYKRSGRGSFKLINIDFSAIDRKSVVTVPEDYDGILDIDLSSGSITVDGVSAGKLIVGNTSGSIEINDVSVSGDVDLGNTSGSIEFTNLKSDGDMEIGNTAGSIEGTIAGKMSDYSISTSVTAGSCNLSDTSGGSKKLTAAVTAGSIEITFTE